MIANAQCERNLSFQCHYCLSNRKFEELVGPLDDILTVSVAQIQRHNATSSYEGMTSFDSRDRLPDVGCFITILHFKISLDFPCF